jgi:hypothetical protein
VPLLARLPDVPTWVVADRGYSGHASASTSGNLGARPAIPTRRDEAPVACPEPIYNNRKKTARSFLGVLSLADTLDWLRR